MKSNLAASLAAAVSSHALLLLALGAVTAAWRFPLSEATQPVNVTFLDGPSLPAPAPASPLAAPQPLALPSAPATAEPTPDIPERVADMPASVPPLIADPYLSRAPAAALVATQPKPALHRKTVATHSAPGPAATLARSAGRRGAPGGASGETGVRYLSNPRPEYPEEARQMRQQGIVYLDVMVNAAGRPDDVSVSHSSGYPMLDNAAIDAVRQWTFEPAQADGFPVSSRVIIPVRFSLSD